MKLMLSQLTELQEVVETHPALPLSSMVFENNADNPVVRYALESSYCFTVSGDATSGYTAEVRPGPIMFSQQITAGSWAALLQIFDVWLICIEREQRARDGGLDGGVMPEWVAGDLPARYTDVCSQLADLSTEAAQMKSFGRLLWQTGDPLVKAVRNAFRSTGVGAEVTEKATTYDVTVDLSEGRRLLVEVTGTTGNIGKSSNKIPQVFATRLIAEPADRIVLVANVYREIPVAQRTNVPITPDALEILRELKVSFVAAPTLFGIWKLSLANQPAAKQHVLDLYALGGGIFQ